MEAHISTSGPWNKGKLIGQKAPLKAREVWAIRTHLQMVKRIRDLALFNLGFDSKLRGCDLVALRVRDICHGDRVANRAMVMQRKTQRPVQFEITQTTRESVEAWIQRGHLRSDDFLFPSRVGASPHLGTRQYARIVHGWAEGIGLDSSAYGTHSMRRTKASMIYKKTKNLRAVQILLGHNKLESTVRYLGIEVDDALDIAEQLDVQVRGGARGAPPINRAWRPARAAMALGGCPLNGNCWTAWFWRRRVTVHGILACSHCRHPSQERLFMRPDMTGRNQS